MCTKLVIVSQVRIVIEKYITFVLFLLVYMDKEMELEKWVGSMLLESNGLYSRTNRYSKIKKIFECKLGQWSSLSLMAGPHTS